MRIMVVDDNDHSLQSLCLVLSDLGHEPRPFNDPLEALDAAENDFYPLIITDIMMPGIDGLELLRRIKQLPECRQSDVVLITGHGDMQTAVEALRKGAYDYLNKPINARELAAVVDRSAEHQSLRIENEELRQQMDAKVAEATRDMAQSLEQARHLLREVTGIGQMVAQSPAMSRLVDEALIMHGNPSVPVLLEGETGTGKEVLAKLIHHGNGASDAPFIGINCAAIPAELFESELFGHEAGAYTGSRSGGAPGKLEAAAGGTVFLDEVAELPLALQPKLLRALEEKAFYRLGGVKRRLFDARVICAANRDLEEMVGKGLFRRDLYHRLRVGHLRIPPLRERGDDIRVLAELVLLREAERKKKQFRAFSDEAMDLLMRYSWPGNVRELENTIERAVLMNDGATLTPAHLSFLTLAAWPDSPAFSASPRPNAEEENWFAKTADGRVALPERAFDLEEFVDGIVRAALARFDGNKTKTANFLGISRFALHRRLQALGKK
jgi:DNA-binding NtrC family response regulator